MRVAIFCGSSRTPILHDEAAAAFARELVERGIGVVYGGGRVGLMGVVADAVLAAGGEVIGVMPQHLVDLEIAHRGVTRLEVVASMHERKARMAELADAFVALPGAAGTLEEVFEVWTWGQLGLHRKPTALLDLGGFYAPLLEQLRVMSATGYLGQPQLDSLGVVADAGQFLEFVHSYRHPEREWLPVADHAPRG
jgi:uncharacterized protein (TIGR00730 family)